MTSPKKALIFDGVVQHADGSTNDIVAVAWSPEDEGEAGVTLEFWPRDRANSVHLLLSLDELRLLLELAERQE